MRSCYLFGDLCDSLYTNIIREYPKFQNVTSNDKFIYIINIADRYAKAAFDSKRKMLYQWWWVPHALFW